MISSGMLPITNLPTSNFTSQVDGDPPTLGKIYRGSVEKCEVIHTWKKNDARREAETMALRLLDPAP
jgi:hypothetical protein